MRAARDILWPVPTAAHLLDAYPGHVLLRGGTARLPAAVVLLVCVPLIPLAIVAVQKVAKRILSICWGRHATLDGAQRPRFQLARTLGKRRGFLRLDATQSAVCPNGRLSLTNLQIPIG